jgi:DNA-binding protein H-NS
MGKLYPKMIYMEGLGWTYDGKIDTVLSLNRRLIMPKLSAEALKAKITALQKQLAAAENNKAPAVRQVKALMKKLGVSLADLANPSAEKRVKGVKKPSQKVAVKYSDANGNTWTGRGKTPRWMVDAEKAGNKRETYLI